MDQKKIIGQDRVCSILERVNTTGRVAHAWLFSGPPGVGKQAMALAFAASLQSDVNGNTVNPEGARKTWAMIHPDVHVLLPSPSDINAEIYQERLTELGTDPYAIVDFVRRPVTGKGGGDKSAFFSIGQVREQLISKARFRPTEGFYQVFIIAGAEYMRESSANAFLKLLEEPSPNTVFILLTEREEKLLPTIRSRCQRIRFDTLQADEISKSLVARFGVGLEKATLLGRMADGSFAKAVEYLDGGDILDYRERVLEFLRATVRRDIHRLSSQIDYVKGLKRDEIRSFLDVLSMWLRDLLIVFNGGDETHVVNIDLRETIHNFCRGLPETDVVSMISLTSEARRLIDRNVNSGLIFQNLHLGFEQCMRGIKSEGLLVALTEAVD